ncbi:Transcription factor E2F7 [Eumeta japonica]|uniref:Transcription factor E2F7 n=1 Tax=Eumeta variegata TaxID=151549 RepID=A0A4C1W5P9_EUMVA|nr:Transcription factor E2F7 [Eumeta japonica]
MQCAVHKRKNTYVWHGASKLNPFLRELKKRGEALRLSDALRGKAPKPPSPKHKTLGVLAQRFLMLFLVEAPNTLINLEMAVNVLIDTSNKNNQALSPEQLERQHKSKVRRLYDIANVFISIGLIQKVLGNLILKKPVFKYIGPIKTKKVEKIDILTPSPLTPLSLLGSEERTPPCHAFSGRSKRKLEFSTPNSFKYYKKNMTNSPLTPCDKWGEILQVADMELTRINNQIL